ncbi:MAG: peptide methionine sulfoxide reductase [Lactobacillaceae bacterium]|nr:peptide methionine sulfoxide reductase [Lactobacillaceae bacterium]
MRNLADFIFYLFEQENEEQLWEVWLAKDVEQSFGDFKKDNAVHIRTKTIRGNDDEVVAEQLAFASKLVKPKKRPQ